MKILLISIFFCFCCCFLFCVTATTVDSRNSHNEDKEIIKALRDRLALASEFFRYTEFIASSSSSSSSKEPQQHGEKTNELEFFLSQKQQKHKRSNRKPKEKMKFVNCSCEDYCQGNCFAPACGVCSPSAFSFPGGESLCFSPGPEGCGLLCHVDIATNSITQQACCSTRADSSCFLPENSCCSSGDCSKCNNNNNNNEKDLPSHEIFPWLNVTSIRHTGLRRRRIFINNTCMYYHEK